MIILILSILILLNIFLLYLLNRKKIKKLFFKSKINKVDISELHKIFQTEKISLNLYSPKKETIIKSFCIPPNSQIPGLTSEYEAWILASLSKVSKNIFEFGTCSGKTTLLLALNSSENSKIFSITLKPDQAKNIVKKKDDNKISYRNILNESIYDKFFFSGSDVEKKIKVIFQNSLEFEEMQYLNQFDLIFIDGGHTYSVIKNDSEKSFKMLNSNGIILWHDYVPGKESAKNVVKYIHEISINKKIFHLKNTSLCFYKNYS